MEIVRYRTIDGLRGIAATAVIAQHCLEFSPLNDPNASIASPFAYIFVNDVNFGRLGVILFFFISGFLIPSSIANQPRPLVSFAIGRFFRLYPLYWFSIILALAVMLLLGNKLPSAATVLANTTMFQMLMGFENVLYPYWTLLIEHFFYILCALLFAAGILHSAARMQYVAIASAAGIILLAVVLIAAPTIKLAKHTASFLFAMIVGHNVRMAQGSGAHALFTRVPILFVVVLALISVARIRVGGYSLLLSPASVFISTVGALFVFLLALRLHAFTSSAFVYAGRISYGLYLFHGIALWIAIVVIGKPSDGVQALLLFVLVFGLAIVTSAVTFKLIEERFIVIGKAVRRRAVRNVGVRGTCEALAPRVADVMAEDALQPFSKEAL